MDPTQHNPNLPKKKSSCLSLSPISHLPFSQLVLLSCPLFQRSPHPRLLVMSIAHLLVDITTKNLSLRLLVRICLRTIPRPAIIPLLHLDTITTLGSLALCLVNSLAILLVLTCSGTLLRANALLILISQSPLTTMIQQLPNSLYCAIKIKN